jgi:hypothetical protein
MVLPDEVWLARKLPALAPVLMKLDGIRVQMHKRLAQNDNRNGIINPPKTRSPSSALIARMSEGVAEVFQQGALT